MTTRIYPGKSGPHRAPIRTEYVYMASTHNGTRRFCMHYEQSNIPRKHR